MSSPVPVTPSPGTPPRRRPGAAVTLLTVVGALVLVAASAGMPPEVAQSPASRYLPADGQRLRYASAAGTLSGDWAVDQATSLINQGPSQVYSWLAMTRLEWATAVLARLSVVQADPSGRTTGRYDDFYSVGTDGIRAEVSISGDGTTQVFVPGRLDLSATPAADRTWTSTGTTAVISASGKTTSHTYRVDYSSAAAGGTNPPGCITVTASQRIDDQDPSAWQNTWCPGRGIVAFTANDSTWTANQDPVPADPGRPADFDWSSADRLAFGPRTMNNPGNSAMLAPSQLPAVLPDGTLVAIQNTVDDLLAIDTAPAEPTMRWRVRTGGRPTSLVALNAITIATDSDRDLVAYGPDGDWRWQARLSDTTVVPPVRIGDVVAVATLDGAVTGYDVATGAERWSRRVGIEIRAPMAVATDRLVVVDQLGQTACIEADGTVAWTASGDVVEAVTITSGAVPVVVTASATSPLITGYALADGSQLWQDRSSLTARSLLGLDGQVVLRDGNRTIGMDAATGAIGWTWDAERTYNGAGGGDRVLLVAASRLILLDAGGRQLKEWPFDIGPVDNNNTWLVTSAGHVLLLGPKGLVAGVAG